MNKANKIQAKKKVVLVIRKFSLPLSVSEYQMNSGHISLETIICI